MVRLPIIIMILPFTLSAQQFGAASYLGTGNAGLGKQSVYSIGNNPAGIAALQRIHVASIYQQHFLFTDIQSQIAFFSIPIAASSAFGGGFSRYGISGVSNIIGLKAVYAKQFAGRMSTAVALNYHRFYVVQYGGDQTYSIDFGFHYTFSEALRIGALIRNVTMSAFSDDVEQWIPAEIGIGTHYMVSPQLHVAVDTYYDMYTKLNAKAGIQYEIHDRVRLQVGLNAAPLQYFAGVGLSIGSIHIDMASSFHSRLGISPQLAISYVF